MLFNDPQCPVRIEEKCPPAVNIMPLDLELKSISTFQFFSRLKGAYFQCRGNIRVRPNTFKINECASKLLEPDF